MQAAQTLPIPSGHPSGVFDAVKAQWAGFRRDSAKRREQQAAIHDLMRFDDLALQDIGITRGDIVQMVRTGRRR